MSKEIIEYEKYGLAVNTFWGGEERKRCVQFTTSREGYTQMTYKNAIKFLKESLRKLKGATNKGDKER